MPAAHAGVAELADARDLKSLGSDTVPVRARSPAPKKHPFGGAFLLPFAGLMIRCAVRNIVASLAWSASRCSLFLPVRRPRLFCRRQRAKRLMPFRSLSFRDRGSNPWAGALRKQSCGLFSATGVAAATRSGFAKQKHVEPGQSTVRSMGNPLCLSLCRRGSNPWAGAFRKQSCGLFLATGVAAATRSGFAKQKHVEPGQSTARSMGKLFSDANQSCASFSSRPTHWRPPVRNIVASLAWSASRCSLFLPVRRPRLFCRRQREPKYCAFSAWERLRNPLYCVKL